MKRKDFWAWLDTTKGPRLITKCKDYIRCTAISQETGLAVFMTLDFAFNRRRMDVRFDKYNLWLRQWESKQ